MLSYTRNPAELHKKADQLGPSASSGTPAEAASFGEAILLSVPWPRVPDALEQAGDLTEKVLIDASNPFPSPDAPAALPAGAFSAAAIVARQASGARVVKAFNTLYYRTLAEQGNRPQDRLAMPLSGDTPADLDLVSSLVRDAGFDPVPIGSLNGAARQEPGSPLYNEELTATNISDRLRMLEHHNLGLARRFLSDVLGGQDPSAYTELVDEDVIVHSGINPLAPMIGKEAFADGLAKLAAFTFTDFVVEDLLAVEDRVLARYRAHGDHTGDQLGVPASGLNITMWEMRLMRWHHDQLVEDYVADINYDWPWLVAPAYPNSIGTTGRH
jgi:hypothetical protein